LSTGTSSKSDHEDSAELGRPGRATVILGRRRLLRGGLSAAPVIMTLASSRVSAGGCQTASAYGSLSPSGTRTSATTCGGRSPEVWATINNSYGPFATNTPFSACLKPTLANDPSIKKVITDPNGTYDPVARHCLAAFLNASMTPVPLTPASILSVAKVQAIWTSYVNNGGVFEPTAGIKWDGPKIVAWIKTTYS